MSTFRRRNDGDADVPRLLVGLVLLGAVTISGCAGPSAEDSVAAEEGKISFPTWHQSKPITGWGDLVLPDGEGSFPAIVLIHGSGGVSAREYYYTGELLDMNVAVLILDSFGPRGVRSTVTGQARVPTRELVMDAFRALRALATHPRIDADRIGVVGFSRGGGTAWHTAVEQLARRELPDDLRFRIHVAFYPGCSLQYAVTERPRGEILVLLGEKDTYTGTETCLTYAEKFEKVGTDIHTLIYPDAIHGWDGASTYNNPEGENYSRCRFEQVDGGSFIDGNTGTTIIRADGRYVTDAYRRAVAACRTKGVSGGPHLPTRRQSLKDLKEMIAEHLF